MIINKINYKQTNTGVIPEDWDVKRFDDCFGYLRTYTFSRNDLGYDVGENSVYNIHYGDIHATFPKNILDTKKDISLIPVIEKSFELNKDDLLRDGDLIMADASEDYEGVGQSVELINVGNKRIVSGTHTFPLRPKEKFAPKYAGYIFSNFHTHKALKKIATGISVFGISKGNIANIELPIPPLPEQERIASCLTTWDKGIEKLSALIQAKKQQKKGLMQQLLTGKKRLEGFTEEWKVIRFDEFANVVRGGSPRPINEYITAEKQGLNWLRIGDIDKDSKYIFSTEEKIKKEGLKKTRLIKKGELILSNSMSFGRPFILKIDTCIHDGWLALTEISDSVDREYLYYLISGSYMQNRFEHLAAGSGVRNLNKELVSELKIKIPCLEEQKAIAEILTNADKEIELLEKKLEAMQLQKQGLMQVLLTGQKRLIFND